MYYHHLTNLSDDRASVQHVPGSFCPCGCHFLRFYQSKFYFQKWTLELTTFKTYPYTMLILSILSLFSSFLLLCKIELSELFLLTVRVVLQSLIYQIVLTRTKIFEIPQQSNPWNSIDLLGLSHTTFSPIDTVFQFLCCSLPAFSVAIEVSWTNIAGS